MARPITHRGLQIDLGANALKRVALFVAAAALLSGCSTLFEGKYDFRDGWRTGKVEQIVSGDALTQPRYWRCTRESSPEELAGKRYAILTYDTPSRSGQRRRHVVALPPDLELRSGQSVYVNAFACKDAIAIPQEPPHAKQAAGRG